MKNLFTGYFIAFTLSFILLSCKKDKEEVIIDDDHKASEVVFTAPENNDQVWNKVTFTTNVGADNEVEKVVFYVADELSGEITSPPFDYILDTKAYNDGPLEIKAIAHYKTGNHEEATLTVNVLNTLFTFDVPEKSEDASVMFLSDQEGNLLGVQSLEKGTTVEFKRPDGFEGEIFNCNIIHEDEYGIMVRTYTDVEILGKEGGLAHVKSYTGPIGNAKITLDVLESLEVIELTGGIHAAVQFNECTDCEIDVVLTKEPANIFVSKGPLFERPYYAFLKDVKAGDVINLEQDDFIPMSNKTVTITDSEYNQASITLIGNDNFSVDYDYYIGRGSGNLSDDIEVYYPEDLFEAYYTTYMMYGGNKRLMYSILGEDFQPFVAPGFDVGAQTGTHTKMEATVSGEFDAYIARWASRIESIDYIHVVYGNSGEQLAVNRPALPNEILEIYPSFKDVAFEPIYLAVEDSDVIRSYNEYVEHNLGINRNEEYDWNVHTISWDFED